MGFYLLFISLLLRSHKQNPIEFTDKRFYTASWWALPFAHHTIVLFLVLHQYTYGTRLIGWSKWRQSQGITPKIGCRVLLRDGTIPSFVRHLWRIVDVYPGLDSIIRVISIITRYWCYQASVTENYSIIGRKNVDLYLFNSVVRRVKVFLHLPNKTICYQIFRRVCFMELGQPDISLSCVIHMMDLRHLVQIIVLEIFHQTKAHFSMTNCFLIQEFTTIYETVARYLGASSIVRKLME